MVTGCDVNCKSCTTNGEGKCDSGQCNDRYVLDSDNTCEGNTVCLSGDDEAGRLEAET